MRADFVEVLVVCSCSVQYALVAALMSGLFPSVLGTLLVEFSCDNLDMAFLMTLYDGFQIAGAFLSTLAVVKIGACRTVAAGGVFSCFGALLFSFAGSYEVLVVAEALLGIGAASINTVCPSLLLEATVGGSTARCALLLSFVYASSSCGVVAAYLTVSAVGPTSWRLFFLVSALLLALPIVLLFWICPSGQKLSPTAILDSVVAVRGTAAAATSAALPEEMQQQAEHSRSGDHHLEQEEEDVAPTCDADHETRVLVSAVAEAHTSSQPPQHHRLHLPPPNPAPSSSSLIAHAVDSFKTLLLNRLVLFIIGVQVCVSFGVSAFIAFIPAFVQHEMGESAEKASRTVGLAIPACTVGMVVSGAVAERMKLTGRGLLYMMLVLTVVLVPLNGAFLIHSLSVFTTALVLYMSVPFSVAVPSTMAFAEVLREEDDVSPGREVEQGQQQQEQERGQQKARFCHDGDKLVSFANALSTACVKLLGASTGPLVLGGLLDRPDLISPRAAYFCCGTFSSLAAFVLAVAAVRLWHVQHP